MLQRYAKFLNKQKFNNKNEENSYIIKILVLSLSLQNFSLSLQHRLVSLA